MLLILDDVRWDALGAAGNSSVRTPRIDELARQGVRFEQARVTTAICMVSRATLLTGQYMSRHGITEFGRAIAPEAFSQTYPALLRRAGYWTGYVGKYGIGQPRQSDFDFLRAYEGTHWMTGSSGERIHVTEKNARDAIAFLQARPKDKSFALTVGFFAPHAEDNAPEQYLPQDWSAKLYDGVTIPPPLRGDPAYMAALPPFLSNEANEGRVRYHWRFDTPERYQAYMTRYHRLITEVDEAVGRIVGELQAQGVYDTTLIAVIGDNGYFQADRGLADKSVPVRGVDPGAARRARPAAGAGAPRPDARSVRPQSRRGANARRRRRACRARGDGGPGSEPALSERAGAGLARRVLLRAPDRHEQEPHPVFPGCHPPGLEVNIEWPEWDFQQLFDLQHDPGEIRNLAGQPAHASRELRMRQQLDVWRRQAR